MAEFHGRYTKRTREYDCPPCPAPPKCSCSSESSSGTAGDAIAGIFGLLLTIILLIGGIIGLGAAIKGCRGNQTNGYYR